MYEEYKPSQCEVNKWHEWKVREVRDHMQREQCLFCKKLHWFNVRDNTTYKNAHIRAFAQPFGYTERLYRQINGNKKLDEMDANLLAKEESRARERGLQEAYDREIELYKKETNIYEV